MNIALSVKKKVLEFVSRRGKLLLIMARALALGAKIVKQQPRPTKEETSVLIKGAYVSGIFMFSAMTVSIWMMIPLSVWGVFYAAYIESSEFILRVMVNYGVVLVQLSCGLAALSWLERQLPYMGDPHSLSASVVADTSCKRSL